MELRRIIAAPQAARGLQMVSELGAMAVVLPELEGLRGVDQSRFHDRDVHGHTQAVASAKQSCATNIGKDALRQSAHGNIVHLVIG